MITRKQITGLVIIALLLALAIGIHIARARIDDLQQDLRNANARADTLRMVADDAAQRLAIEVDGEREMRRLAEAKLGEVEGELSGTIRALSSVTMQLETLRDSVATSGPGEVDTLGGGFLRIRFPREVRKREGYWIGFYPAVTLPDVPGLNTDSVSVAAVLETGFDPIQVDLALTEDRAGVWEATTHTSSPLFRSFGNVETHVNPYRPGFFDLCRVHGAVGFATPVGLYGQVGLGFSWWNAQAMAGPGVAGGEVGGYLPLRKLWPF